MSQKIHKRCKNKNIKENQKMTRRRLKKKLQKKVSSDLDDFMLGNQKRQKVNITSAYNDIYNSQNIAHPPRANLIPTSSKQEFTTPKPIKVKFWSKDDPIHGNIAHNESDKKHIEYEFLNKFRQGELQEIQMDFW